MKRFQVTFLVKDRRWGFPNSSGSTCGWGSIIRTIDRSCSASVPCGATVGANKGEIDVGETDRLVSADSNLGGDEGRVF